MLKGGENVNLDSVSLGKYIRKIRKEKNLTLKELSEGIFSVSKMSYIESGNGHLSENQLKEICTKLEINFSELVEHYSTKHDSSIPLDDLEHHLFLGLYSSVEKKIKKIEEQRSTETLDQFRFLFLCGEYYYLINNFNKSIATLLSMEKYVLNDTKNLKYLHRSYNLLSTIYFKLEDYTESKKYINKALRLRKNEDELWKTELNAAILFAMDRKYIESQTLINRINKRQEIQYLTKNKTLYFQFVLDILEGEYKKPSDFQNILDELKLTKDYELITRLDLIKWNMFPEKQSFIEETYELELDLLMINKDKLLGLEKVLLELLHTFIKSLLEDKNYTDSLKYIEKAYNLAEMYPSLERNYLTCYFHAKLVSQTEPENIKRQLELYKNAQIYLQGGSILSLNRGLINYEIGKLTEEPIKENKHQYLALEAFYYNCYEIFTEDQTSINYLPGFCY